MILLFFLLWLILNSRITIECCLFGLIISVLIGWFCRSYLGFKTNLNVKILSRIGMIIVYILNLIKEIILSNIQVIKLVLSPKINIRPRIVYFQANSIKSLLGKVILANSITLTPGTITVDMDDTGYYVHVLNPCAGVNLEHSSFVKLLGKMENL